jgi:hypothetical protein
MTEKLLISSPFLRVLAQFLRKNGMVMWSSNEMHSSKKKKEIDTNDGSIIQQLLLSEISD